MKTVFLALTVLGLCAQAHCASLTTVDGATYDRITNQRVDPDGVYIEYAMPNGGVGMSKIKFARLSADQQKQFGFDVTKARDYETQVAKANEDFRQESLRMEQIAQGARQIRAAQDESAAANARMVAMAQANSAPQDPTVAYTLSGGGIGLYAVPRTGPAPPAKRVYAPIVTPIPFPKTGITRAH